MRVVLDTNVIISALIAPNSLPGAVLRHWLDHGYDLLTCAEQIDELRRVSRYDKIRALVPAHLFGNVVNDLREAAVWIARIPVIDLCSDPMDNFLLGLAEAGKADWLVSGDKADLLSMGQHRQARIVSVRQFADTARI